MTEEKSRLCLLAAKVAFDGFVHVFPITTIPKIMIVRREQSRHPSLTVRGRESGTSDHESIWTRPKGHDMWHARNFPGTAL